MGSVTGFLRKYCPGHAVGSKTLLRFMSSRSDSESARPSKTRTRFLADRTYSFEGQLDLRGLLSMRVVTCQAWLLELYELERGDFSLFRDQVPVRPQSRRFGVLSSAIYDFANVLSDALAGASLDCLGREAPGGLRRYRFSSRPLKLHCKAGRKSSRFALGQKHPTRPGRFQTPLPCRTARSD